MAKPQAAPARITLHVLVPATQVAALDAHVAALNAGSEGVVRFPPFTRSDAVREGIELVLAAGRKAKR